MWYPLFLTPPPRFSDSFPFSLLSSLGSLTSLLTWSLLGNVQWKLFKGDTCLRERYWNPVLMLFGQCMWEASIWLPVLCIGDHPGPWPASSSIRRETGDRRELIACLFSPPGWEPLVTQTVLRAVCASMLGEECLLSTYCMPNTFIILLKFSFNF